MSDPILDLNEAIEPLNTVHEAAAGYLSSLSDRKVRDITALDRLAELQQALPADGMGGTKAVAELLDLGTATATLSSGPRFFHFVIGGATPAAMAADWLTSLLDQNAFSRVSSDFASAVEDVALQWLCELVGLPDTWGGALVGSATFANFTGLACATHWWGRAARCRCNWPRPSGCRTSHACALRRVRTPQRTQGLTDARPWAGFGSCVRCRRCREKSIWPHWTGGWAS